MIDTNGNKITISFEFDNYAIEYHESEDNFYDMVVRFQNANEIDELISKLTKLKEIGSDIK